MLTENRKKFTSKALQLFFKNENLCPNKAQNLYFLHVLSTEDPLVLTIARDSLAKNSCLTKIVEKTKLEMGMMLQEELKLNRVCI